MDESYLKRPCPFLVKRTTCRIYALRPEGCKAYPFHVTRPFLYLDPKCAYSAAIQDFFEQHQTAIEVLAEKIWSQLDEAKYARCRTIYVKAGFDWEDKVANGSLAGAAALDKTRLLHTRPGFVVPEVDTLSVTVQVEEAIRDTLKNRQTP